MEAAVGPRAARGPVGRLVAAAGPGRDVHEPHLDVGQRPARVNDDASRDRPGAERPQS